jgi:ferredoxin
MSYRITSDCIHCQRCLAVCPSGAVQQVGLEVWIDPNQCTECTGAYSSAQCAAVCPTNRGCLPSIKDYWEGWFSRYYQQVARLQQAGQADYWEDWFNRYSQTLRQVLQSHQATLATSKT